MYEKEKKRENGKLISTKIMSATEDAVVSKEAGPEAPAAPLAELPTQASETEPSGGPLQVEDQAATEEQENEEEPEDGVPRVLVTGASGYIASQLVKCLLEDEKFRVRGTVRSKKNKEKTQPILDLVPGAKYRLRLVEADLLEAGSWAKAVHGCSNVFHVASPFPGTSGHYTPEMEETMLVKPAVEGTINVLQACADAGTVKRVVLTSSIAAISSGVHGIPGKPADYVYTEADWSDESTCEPYERSKTKAERAAWDFMEKLSEDKRFELVVVNPGYVQGPLLSCASGVGTRALCYNFLSGKIPGLPDVSFGLVDVRDVVIGHKIAMERPEAAGQRHLLVTNTVPLREIGQILKEEFKPQGYKFSTIPFPKIGMWFAKFFDNTAKEMYSQVGVNLYYSKEKMEEDLGVKPYSIKDTLIDTCYSLIELGIVKKTQQYKGPKATRPTPPPATDPSTTPDQSTSAPELDTSPANVLQELAHEEEPQQKEAQEEEPQQQKVQEEPQQKDAQEEEPQQQEAQEKEPQPQEDQEEEPQQQEAQEEEEMVGEQEESQKSEVSIEEEHLTISY